MDKSWKVIVAFTGVFITGAIAGAAICSLWYMRPLPVGIHAPGGPKQAPSQQPGGPQGSQGSPGQAGSPHTQGKATIEQFSHSQLSFISKKLDLSPEQAEALKPIIAKAGEDLRSVRRSNFLAYAEIIEHINTEVAKILTPEQRARFEKLRLNQRDKLKGLMGTYGVKPKDLPYLMRNGSSNKASSAQQPSQPLLLEQSQASPPPAKTKAVETSGDQRKTAPDAQAPDAKTPPAKD